MYNIYISEVRTFRMRLEGYEERLLRQIRTPLDRDDLEESMRRILEQEVGADTLEPNRFCELHSLSYHFAFTFILVFTKVPKVKCLLLSCLETVSRRQGHTHARKPHTCCDNELLFSLVGRPCRVSWTG